MATPPNACSRKICNPVTTFLDYSKKSYGAQCSRKISTQYYDFTQRYLNLCKNTNFMHFFKCYTIFEHDRFRCGSHHLPIETLRWSRVTRENRLCEKCRVLGDEYHFIFHCIDFPGYFGSCNNDLSAIWQHNDLFRYFNKLSQSEYMRSY